ncbi:MULTISPECIES: hypothetical protein [unclassified Lonepinella]|uniref:hypothetical protein n=1 Tax=unclassified Lonepinella TaxID=2642006 RepID=UPI0036D8CC54
MKKIVKFLLPSQALNDATEYYCNLIERAFDIDKYDICRTGNTKDISSKDILVNIRSRDLYLVRNKPKKIISWFQGVYSEEYELLYGKGIRSFLVGKVLNYFDKKALKRSDLFLFVSERMLKYYEQKYKICLQDKSVIIPCYNQSLDRKLINKERYQSLKFVYAGGLFAWQCIDDTLRIFQEIYHMNNSAELTILTADKDKAETLISKYGVENTTTKYVSLNELPEELAKYKYAFLIRENHIVNNVSTPTKMNSYLAAGLLPIYTNVIDDFEENIELGEFGIKISTPINIKSCAELIIEHHKKEIDTDKLYQCFLDHFESYYNDEKHLKILSGKLKKLGI